ncbi:MAG: hypothetical protein GKR90_09260 [Pseudomonadales bacterium]|nr:hypothetical protein [Pseudomonadales bacterium]
MNQAQQEGPLKGVKILDLTHVWAGPLAVRYLSDLGAEVVKVEAPMGRGPQEFPYAPLGGWLGGDAGDDPWNRNAIFAKLMRNRRSLCMDLKTETGRHTFLDLVAEADVLMENFSARAMPSLGLGYDELRARNERLIYVTMPGFGHAGALKERVAFGPTVEAMSGLTEILGYGPEEPRNTAMALMDPITAMNSVASVVTALQERQETGEGVRIEMSLHEGGVAYSGPWLIDRQLGRTVQSIGNAHPELVPHGVYRCAGDDEWLALACVDDDQWRALAGLLELDSTWSRDLREDNSERIDEAIGKWLAPLNKQDAAEKLQALGVAAGPINTVPDMVSDPQVVSRGFFVPYERFATPMPGTPIKMQGVDPDTWTPCPGLGEDNVSVLEDWLGMSEEAVAAITTAGVLHDKPPM